MSSCSIGMKEPCAHYQKQLEPASVPVRHFEVFAMPLTLDAD